jgi:hypothetical protein
LRSFATETSSRLRWPSMNSMATPIAAHTAK